MKKETLPFGNSLLELTVPDSTDILESGQIETLADPVSKVYEALHNPIASAPLKELARNKNTAAVIVSDKTRPVPYKEPNGILHPLIKTLKDSGIKNIKIIVAYGTHKSMTENQLRNMLGSAAFEDGVEIINHDCTDNSQLRSIGCTSLTPSVTINRHYLQADLKIATGLVEPHFMAGFSGGPKAICPGISGQSVTYGFHSAEILSDENSSTLILDKNPCHKEALKIAKLAGLDFLLNVTIDSSRKITGIFAGDLEKAHRKAVEFLNSYVTIPLEKLYDCIITQSGEAGINHYQAAKAVYETANALAEDGKIILAADLIDDDPIGNTHYKQLLPELVKSGPQKFIDMLLSEQWQYVHEQWGIQMWAKAFNKLSSPKHLYMCAPQLQDYSDDLFLENNVAWNIHQSENEQKSDYAARMMQATLDKILQQNKNADVLILPDGPYAIPVYKG